jgi:hypothetical protein
MDPCKPDLKFADFSLWVLEREFPDRSDYWDGNWLIVRARVETIGATVEACGPILHGPEIKAFAETLERLNRNLKGHASLRCMEPNLDIVIRGDALGRLKATITITPDHMAQSHSFIFSTDQTLLSPLIAECQNILSRWPIRGTP